MELVRGARIAKPRVELAVIEGHLLAGTTLRQHQLAVVEPAEVPAVSGALDSHRAGDGCQGNDEVLPKVLPQAKDEPLDVLLAHGLLDVDVEPLQAVALDDLPELVVVSVEDGLVGRVERVFGECADSGAADHAHDLDAGVAEDLGLLPEGAVARVDGAVIVEGDVAVFVDVQGADDEVREGDVLFGDERQHGYGLDCLVVGGLVVNDEAGDFGADDANVGRVGLVIGSHVPRGQTIVRGIGVGLKRVGGYDGGGYYDGHQGGGRTEDGGPHGDGRSVIAMVPSIRFKMEALEEELG